MPYKHNEPRRHKIPKAKYKVSNWREYDQALQQRGSLTVWVTPEALEAWASAKTGQRGRPTSYSDIVIESAVMLRLAMGKPWRQTGAARSGGSGSPGQVGDGIDFGIEQRFEAGSELAVEDSALEQEIGAPAGPPHLLGFVHAAVDQEVGGPFRDRRADP